MGQSPVMGTLYFVRHGQASFGAADYDQLSEMGQRQCLRLGEYLHHRGMAFEAVWRGTLKRHAQSLVAIAQTCPGLPEATVDAALNEYDSGALLATMPAEKLAGMQPSTTPEGYKQHFRLLREAIQLWMEGAIAPAGMPGFADFLGGLRRVLAELHRNHRGDVLIVSSGGPISCVLADVLNAPPATAIEMNMRMKNSSINELATTAKGFALQSYNSLPHFADAAFADFASHT
jgi:broad specificity phosphatase PhoE